MVLFSSLDGLEPEFFEKKISLLPKEKQFQLLSVKNERSKKETVLAWLLLRRALKMSEADVFPPLSFSKKGKPCFENGRVHFNLSHSGNIVCAAVCEVGEIGVDVQKISVFSENVKKRVFCENELKRGESAAQPNAFFTGLWAIKESCLKQSGVGIAFDLRTLDFSKECLDGYFEKDGLYYTVKQIGDCFFSVCTPQEGEQTFVSTVL